MSIYNRLLFNRFIKTNKLKQSLSNTFFNYSINMHKHIQHLRNSLPTSYQVTCMRRHKLGGDSCSLMRCNNGRFLRPVVTRTYLLLHDNNFLIIFFLKRSGLTTELSNQCVFQHQVSKFVDYGPGFARSYMFLKCSRENKEAFERR